jgi:hypothetical protein
MADRRLLAVRHVRGGRLHPGRRQPGGRASQCTKHARTWTSALATRRHSADSARMTNVESAAGAGRRCASYVLLAPPRSPGLPAWGLRIRGVTAQGIPKREGISWWSIAGYPGETVAVVAAFICGAR